MAAYGFRFAFPDVQDALAAAIALKMADGVPVSVGYPRGGVQEEHVWIDGSVDVDMPRHLTGYASRDEECRLSVRILVSLTAEDMVDARDAAVELAHRVEDAMAADRTLGGLVTNLRTVGAVGEEAIPEERTRQYGITLTVGFAATAAADTVPAP